LSFSFSLDLMSVVNGRSQKNDILICSEDITFPEFQEDENGKFKTGSMKSDSASSAIIGSG